MFRHGHGLLDILFNGNLHFLSHVIIDKANVLLSEALFTLAFFFYFWLFCSVPLVFFLSNPITYLTFKYFGFERAW